MRLIMNSEEECGSIMELYGKNTFCLFKLKYDHANVSSKPVVVIVWTAERKHDQQGL